MYDQANKEWSNDGRDVSSCVGDPHQYPCKVRRQVQVVDVEAHVNTAIDSDGDCVKGDG